MSRLVALVLTVLGAKFATAAASTAECQGTECQDETSLVQVKASIKRHTDDEDDGNNPATKDISLFFKNKEDLIAGLREASDCLKEGTFGTPTAGGYPNCKLTSGDKDGGICQKCIEDQWATTKSGVGYDCCSGMETAEIQKAPLCGVCLRSKKKGLKGVAGKNMDQSAFTKCAKYYCAASGKVKPEDLGQIAHWCSPSMTQNKGPSPKTNMIGIVANNPKKNSLETFLIGDKAGVRALNKNITGTKSSSDMAQCVTEAKKSDFSTFSGPWGGDAQLAGLLAAQSFAGAHKYIDALIFFDEKKEAHKEDILALVAVMKSTMDSDKIAFTPTDAKKLITKLQPR